MWGEMWKSSDDKWGMWVFFEGIVLWMEGDCSMIIFLLDFFLFAVGVNMWEDKLINLSRFKKNKYV